MKSVLGSGGRTKVLLVVEGGADERDLPGARSTSRPSSSTVMPPMRCLASWSGLRLSRHCAHLVHERPADRVLGGDQLDELLPGLVAGRQRLAEQHVEVEHLDAAGPHLLHELVVLVLGALHPEHVVEEQLVVVGGGEALQAQVRSVDHHLAELSHLRVHAEGSSSPPCSSASRAPRWCRRCPPRSARCQPARRSRPAGHRARRTEPPPRPSAPSTRPRSRARAARPA